MYLLERDLEEIIFNTDAKELANKGLHINGKLYRQLKIGNHGTADLICVSRDRYPIGLNPMTYIPTLCISIIELKKDKIGISAFLQAVGYVKGISEYLKYRNFSNPIEFKIILIGKQIDINSTFCYLSEFIPSVNEFEKSFLDIYTYDYNINGVKFELQEIFDMNNNGF